MAQSTESVIRDTLLCVLASSRSVLVALGDDDAVMDTLPRDGIFQGLEAGALAGRPLGRALKADYVRVFEGADSWDELGYFVDGSGSRRPYLVRRLEGEQPFSPLFPGAARYVMASPLSAYASLESKHERDMQRHAEELEAVNRKLVRRTRRLRSAMEVLEARNKQMIGEMNLAVELQKSLLPKSYPRPDLVAFTHRYIPLAMVGGDFFDIVDLGDDRVGVMISDVSGHGVAPAFITAMIKSAFDYVVAKDPAPASVMGRLNEEFGKIIETDHFVTAFYCVLDFKAMTLRFCGAGHPPQLIAHADGGFTELPSVNPMIGLLDSYDYAEGSVRLLCGDTLCFYTDGVIESRAADESLFGLEGIERSLLAARNESMDGIADRLITDLIQFMKDPYFEDDITMLFGQVIESL